MEPTLYKNKMNGMVVLFTGLNEGVVVQPGGWPAQRGLHQANWIPCNDSSIWELFEGTLELDNSHLLPKQDEMWRHKEDGTRYRVLFIANEERESTVVYECVKTKAKRACSPEVFLRNYECIGALTRC